MKVIFLDFDGVLNCAEYRAGVENYYGNFIDERKLDMLSDFVAKTGAKIVLTTDWRFKWNEGEKQLDPDGERINDLFEKHGMKIYSKTPYLLSGRDFEIADWLMSREVENYVIFDDVDCFRLETNRAHFVKTDDAQGGLTAQNLDYANLILKDFKS